MTRLQRMAQRHADKRRAYANTKTAKVLAYIAKFNLAEDDRMNTRVLTSLGMTIKNGGVVELFDALDES